MHSSSTGKEHTCKIPPPFLFFFIFFVSSKLTACLIYLRRKQKHIDRGAERKRGESWHRGQAQARALTSTLPPCNARTPNRGIPAPALPGAFTAPLTPCRIQSGPGKTRHGVRSSSHLRHSSGSLLLVELQQQRQLRRTQDKQPLGFFFSRLYQETRKGRADRRRCPRRARCQHER